LGAFSHGKFVRYLVAHRTPTVLIDAVHAASPRNDAHTGEMAEAAARRLGSHCIVALVSRERADLNRPRNPANAAAIDEYRAAIRTCPERTGLTRPDGRVRTPVLHVAIPARARARARARCGGRHGTDGRGGACDAGSVSTRGGRVSPTRAGHPNRLRARRHGASRVGVAAVSPSRGCPVKWWSWGRRRRRASSPSCLAHSGQ
jgi:hypothetical protein